MTTSTLTPTTPTTNNLATTPNTHTVNTRKELAGGQPLLDSFWKIAKHHNVSFQKLKQLNSGKGASPLYPPFEQRTPPYALYDGDVIILPESLPANTYKIAGDAVSRCPKSSLLAAVLPVRYAIASAEDAENIPYQSQAQLLDQNFPKINSARYILRRLRDGLLYLYIDGQLEIFHQKNGSLSIFNDPDSNPKAITRIARSAGEFLLIPQDKTVLACYSEHQWSPEQCLKILKNINGARDRQMQALNLQTNGQKDTITPDKLTEQVLEYNPNSPLLQWSDTPLGQTRHADGVQQAMSQYARQHVLVLHDPIAISHDFSALLENALQALQDYISAPEPGDSAGQERYRKKMVSDIIEGMYRDSFNRAQDPDQPGDINTIAHLRQEHYQANEVNIHHRPPRNYQDFVQEVLSDEQLTPIAQTIRELIDEPARQAFINQYHQQLQQYQQQLLAIKQDRFQWLSQWQQTDSPKHLGTAWAAYDDNDKDDWTLFGLSLTRSLSLMAAVTLPASIKKQDPELELLRQWTEDEPDSPIHRALAGHPPLKQLLDKIRLNPVIKQQISQSNPGNFSGEGIWLWDRNAAMTDSLSNIMEQIYQQFPIKGTVMEELVQNVTIAQLSNPRLSGHPMNRINESLDNIVNNQNIAQLWKVLCSRGGNYQLKVQDLKPETVIHYINGALKDTALPEVRTHISTEGVVGLRRPIKNGQPTGKAIQHTRVFTIVTEQVSRQKSATMGDLHSNPFKGMVSTGVSSVVVYFTLLNLVSAVESFQLKQFKEDSVNFLSAIAAIGSGVNSLLMSMEISAPKVHSKVTSHMLGEFMAGIKGLKLFGYGGAFLSGLTDIIRAFKRFEANDNDAALMYSLSAATVTAGGIAMTQGSLLALSGTASLIPIAGWLVAGVVLVGVSIWTTAEAIENTHGPREYWLDACVFGKHILEDNPVYNNLKEEQQDFIKKMLTPQLIKKGIGHNRNHRGKKTSYNAQLALYLPYFSNKSQLTVQCQWTDKKTGLFHNTNPQPKTMEGYLQGVKVHYRIKLSQIRPDDLVFTVQYHSGTSNAQIIKQTYSLS